MQGHLEQQVGKSTARLLQPQTTHTAKLTRNINRYWALASGNESLMISHLSWVQARPASTPLSAACIV
jgi:hypothetical protein